LGCAARSVSCWSSHLRLLNVIVVSIVVTTILVCHDVTALSVVADALCSLYAYLGYVLRRLATTEMVYVLFVVDSMIWLLLQPWVIAVCVSLGVRHLLAVFVDIDTCCDTIGVLELPNSISLVSKQNFQSCRARIGGGARSVFLGAMLAPYVTDHNNKPFHLGSRYTFELQCTNSEVDNLLKRDANSIAAVLPISLITEFLTKKELSHLAKLHGLWVPSRMSVVASRYVFNGHDCTDCSEVSTIFKCVEYQKDLPDPDANRELNLGRPSKFVTVARARKESREKHLKASMLRATRRKEEGRVKNMAFPPKPLNLREAHRILTRTCQGMAPSRFVEAGCAVCGCLTPVRELSPLKDFTQYLQVLCRPGVTRQERFSDKDPIKELDGPVLAEGCSQVCVTCEIALVNKKIPKCAMVLHNWVGAVPPQLQDLTYAEKLMIAKVRHNKCVVRVRSGRVRMSANAIMFSQPILKVYNKLPPSRKEMQEILAFVYIGSSQPTLEDFERTPLLVRRKKILDALEWLKLNHEGYRELEISLENLNSYAERDIPVVVDYRPLAVEEDSIPTIARSVHEKVEEHGTESGECTFVVHGLTGEEYSKATISSLKLIALEHVTRKGGVLGIGRSEQPVSMYDAVAAYPAMFPWLFPYGKGGIGHKTHKHRMGEQSRKRNLLMYHDKRFQLDPYFPMIAFNHEQMKASSNASRLLADKSKFNAVKARLNSVNPEVVANIADRLASGEYVKPATDAERLCFDLVKDLDAVAGRVQGSMTSKKYMRNDIWSTTSFFNAPTWFITLAWADILHPIALYYAQSDTLYRPEMRTSTDRYKLMSKNPVSAARFFNFMVKSFLMDVLGWKQGKGGLFGHPKAYYGTVEQQGRLTLHLHLLLWIENSLSPQEIRKRVMDPSSSFQRKLIAYLEACHQAEFINGSLAEIQAVSKMDLKAEAYMKGKPEYIPPTHTLPTVPPVICKRARCMNQCSKCKHFVKWWTDVTYEIDDLLLRSNMHDHLHSVVDEVEKDNKRDWRKLKQKKVPKHVQERKGCLTKYNVCRARFPRKVIEETTVGADGRIEPRHMEPMMNSINPILTYVSRCNSDVTSLLSGTSVKAVISYVSDYISKVSLKSYQLFASVFQVFESSKDMLRGPEDNHERSRHLVRKMVNSLSTKMEIGSPMASMYVLGHPDHYASHIYVPFYWKSYVSHVKRYWASDDITQNDSTIIEERVTIDRQNGKIVAGSLVDDYIYRPVIFERVTLYEWIQCANKQARTAQERKAFSDSVAWTSQLLFNQADSSHYMPITESTSTDNAFNDPSDSDSDYFDDIDDIYSDVFSESDWETDDETDIIIEKQNKFDKRAHTGKHPFVFGHPRYETHSVSCDFSRTQSVIPNFIGGAIPRSDKGDRSHYCMTMLTLFKPWRSPGDLKDIDQTWSDAHYTFHFTERQLQLMANFNVRYECNDARDDHYATQQKLLKSIEETHPCLPGTFDKLRKDMDPDLYDLNDDDNESDEEESSYVGRRTLAIQKQVAEITGVLRDVGWLRKTIDANHSYLIRDRLLPPYKTRNAWSTLVKNERMRYISNKLADIPLADSKPNHKRRHWDNVEILNYDYFFPTSEEERVRHGDLKSAVIDKFKLNTEQMRAFTILADHASSPQKVPLRMYMGGMGGTGKSQVINAMIEFFNCRNESYRFIVLGPTGSVAALLNGSTYHSVFKVPRDTKSKNQDDMDGVKNESVSLAAVNERLQGVDYVFLDEISMVSCTDLQLIATQASKARNIHDTSFGSLSFITAGDFTQLPPTTGASLYSHTVDITMRLASDVRSQNAVLGKVLWHQFNTVIILRQNMRQNTQTEEDDKFRTALSNMRYGACTPDDLQFLRTRVAGFGPGQPRMDSSEFRNASIITARNSQKDTINMLGAQRFAYDTGQTLVQMLSVDRISPRAVDRTRWKSCEQSDIRSISPKLQQYLWDALPVQNSEMIPGTLPLCIGMPVLLRSNDATELCMTKGQEGVVVGWDESVGPSGQKILDTLFVELINLPKDRTVQVADLPVNVVPLSRCVTHTTMLLQDDTIISLMREQAVVLLNFAMTDYSSQGKSRTKNPVDLTNCRDHRAYYVALSRATSAAGLIILQDFDEAKITSGMSGYLRQELRELELLDEITRLRYEGHLPREVCGIYRRQLIRSYLIWRCQQLENIPACDDKKWFTDVDIPEQVDYSEWRPSDKPSNKRKADCQTISIDNRGTLEQDRKKMRIMDASLNISKQSDAQQIRLHAGSVPPIGLSWDSGNYSCGYDATISVLRSIWVENEDQWTVRMSSISDVLSQLVSSLEQVRANNCSFENCRDVVRRYMHNLRPDFFPYGINGTSIDRIAQVMIPERTYAVGNQTCEQCGFIDPTPHSMFEGFMCAIPSRSQRALFPEGLPVSQWIKDLMKRGAGQCPACRSANHRVKLTMRSRMLNVPYLMILSIDGGQFEYNRALQFDCNGIQKVLVLRGVIYQGGAHFTCRIITSSGGIWYHDGMTTGSQCVHEGEMNDIQPEFLRSAQDRVAVALIYAQTV
jgi:hypothetical protein